MPLEILAMAENDLEEVLVLWTETDGVGLNESDTLEHLRAYLKRNPGLSLVVRDGEQAIGAVLCGHDGRRGYLNHLAVRPEYRKRGLGSQMVETCLASLKCVGILRCNIFLFAGNELGERFWKRHGWLQRSDLQVMQRQCLSK